MDQGPSTTSSSVHSTAGSGREAGFSFGALLSTWLEQPPDPFCQCGERPGLNGNGHLQFPRPRSNPSGVRDRRNRQADESHPIVRCPQRNAGPVVVPVLAALPSTPCLCEVIEIRGQAGDTTTPLLKLDRCARRGGVCGQSDRDARGRSVCEGRGTTERQRGLTWTTDYDTRVIPLVIDHVCRITLRVAGLLARGQSRARTCRGTGSAARRSRSRRR